MKCSHCQADNPPGGRFCVHCGTDLEKPRVGRMKSRRSETTLKILRETLSAKFELQDSVGTGGMGDVFVALHRQLNSKVAIKVLQEAYNRDPAMVTRFHREARAAAQLSHPNIIPIFDIGVAGEYNYFVMRYIDGEDLRTLLQREGPLPLERTVSIAIQVARALDYAHHKGIVHRDIKPANILIDREGTAIVTDFGIARVLASGQLTAKGAIVGTPHYMSPEQARGDLVDYRADLYSLGVVLYQMLTGKLPFDAGEANALLYKHLYEEPAPVRKLRAELGADISGIVAKLLAKSPSDRFSDAASLIRSLARVELTGPVVPAGTEEGLSSFDAGSRRTAASGSEAGDILESANMPSVVEATRRVTQEDLAAMKSTGSSPLLSETGEDATRPVSLEELAALALKDSSSGRARAAAPEAALSPDVADAARPVSLEELAAMAVQRKQPDSNLTESPQPVPVPGLHPLPGPSESAASAVVGALEEIGDGAPKTSPAEPTRQVFLDDLYSPVAGPTPAVGQFPAETELKTPAGISKVALYAAAAGVLVFVLGIGLMLRRPTTPASPAETPAPAAPAVAVATQPESPPVSTETTLPVSAAQSAQMQLSDWLARGESAFRERRFTTPEGDNALYYFTQALQSDPSNAQAARGIKKVARAYFEMGKSAEAAGNRDKARGYYQKALDIDPQLGEAQAALSPPAKPPGETVSLKQPAIAKGLVEAPSAPDTDLPRARPQGPVPSEVAVQRPKPGKVYEMTQVSVKPEAVRQVAPIYPENARRRRLEDIIVLRVLVSEGGDVLDTQVLRGARVDAQFEKAASEAVRQWRFKPAQKDGRPVSVWYNIAVPFQLRK